MVRVRRPLDEALLLERVEDLAHRLRRHVRAPRELRVRELAAALEDAERRVLERRQPVRLDALVDLGAQRALEPRDDVADARLGLIRAGSGRRAGSVIAVLTILSGNLRFLLPDEPRPHPDRRCGRARRPAGAVVRGTPDLVRGARPPRSRRGGRAARAGCRRGRPRRDQASELARIRRRVLRRPSRRCDRRPPQRPARAARGRGAGRRRRRPVAFVDEELPTEGEARRARSWSAIAVDPAVILFTSGTSGRPKGAILTHGGILAAARNAADALALGPDGRRARRGAVLARARPVDGHRLDAARGRRRSPSSGGSSRSRRSRR